MVHLSSSHQILLESCPFLIIHIGCLGILQVHVPWQANFDLLSLGMVLPTSAELVRKKYVTSILLH